MKAIESLFPDKIYVTPHRFATIWGGTSFLKMLIESFKAIINKKEWEWDFVVNLSESDYPLKQKEDLVSFLNINQHKNFVSSVLPYENG